jgi:alpha-L-rhamnosidase
MAMLNGSAGWGDAVVIVPWRLYRAYGDERILAEMWPAMTAWMSRAETMARRPPSPYLWDTGFHWGEWLEPGGSDPFDPFAAADHSDVATAYLAHSAGLMARIAGVLGKPAARYRTLADGARSAWQRTFVAPGGALTPDTQANHVRALAFGLVPPSLRPAVAARLVALIRAAGTRLGTGFLATPDLLPVLADNGHLDVAYELLLRDGVPSWLGMIDRGATTMWERWDGIDESGVAHESLNHYAKGAVVSFLHRYVAGLTPVDVAYRHFRVQPRPGGGLTSASAVHDSPYGRIEVSWTAAPDRFALSVTVPPGTTALAVLPDGSENHLAPGDHQLQ